jgi:hypothetical protein
MFFNEREDFDMSNNPMKQIDAFDFWYAVNNTEVVLMPKGHLETFGTTVLHYHLISELMDTVGQIRVREGRIRAGRPQIVTPEAYQKTLLEGFGEEAERYIEWMREHERDMRVLQYGYSLRRESFNEYLVSDSLASVVERVKQDVGGSDDPLSAVVVGVDKPWDVCLVKLFREVIQQSAMTNIREMERKQCFDDVDGLPRGVRNEIEADFLHASKTPTLVNPLAEKLQRLGVFEEYEDRFFSLVKATRGM